jgi:hypothetical protein
MKVLGKIWKQLSAQLTNATKINIFGPSFAEF